MKQQDKEIIIVAAILFAVLVFTGTLNLSTLSIANLTLAVSGTTLTAAAPTSNVTNIQSGGSVLFTPHVTGGTKPFNYVWYQNTAKGPSCTTANKTGSTAANPVFTPNVNTWYTYSVSDSETPSVFKCAGLAVEITIGMATSTSTVSTTTTVPSTSTTSISTSTTTVPPTTVSSQSTTITTTVAPTTTTCPLSAGTACTTTSTIQPTTTIPNPGNPSSPNILTQILNAITSFLQQYFPNGI